MSGDLNRDGKIDRVDVEALKRLLSDQGHGGLLAALSPEERQRLDINADGQLDADDVEALLAKMLHQQPGADDLLHKFRALRDKARPEG